MISEKNIIFLKKKSKNMVTKSTLFLLNVKNPKKLKETNSYPMKKEIKNQSAIEQLVSMLPANEVLTVEDMIRVRGGDGESKPILPPPPTSY